MTKQHFSIMLLALSTVFHCFAQTIDKESITPDTTIFNPQKSKKKIRYYKQQPIEQEEQIIDQESALFGATQPESQSESPEGFLRGESN